MRNGIELKKLLQKLQRIYYGSKQALRRGSGLMTTVTIQVHRPNLSRLTRSKQLDIRGCREIHIKYVDRRKELTQ